MREYKKLLTSFVEVIIFLLCAFGGFFKRIAPPDQVHASYAVGIVSFLALIILMIISALSRQSVSDKSRKRWIIAGVACLVVAVPATYLYPTTFNRYTYIPIGYSDTRHINASLEYLTLGAKQYLHDHPGALPAELEQNFDYGQIWTQEGLNKAERKLLISYLWLVLALSCTIFCLLEANVMY